MYMKIEKLRQDWDVTAQMIVLTDKINEIIEVINNDLVRRG